MYFGTLNIPDEILNAQADGTLVIFAGAGISRDAPSCLPDFNGLALQIGAGTSLPFTLDPKEPIDRYLGRLEKKGVSVHSEAHQILTKENPMPNEYHKVLPRLFPDIQKLRIVSTNQDDLLIDGIGEHLADIPLYEAPALPLGDKFNGIVFLHGNVRQDPKQMVFTDADFGRAYLTEGWARRFLLKLFEKNTVLFRWV